LRYYGYFVEYLSQSVAQFIAILVHVRLDRSYTHCLLTGLCSLELKSHCQSDTDFCFEDISCPLLFEYKLLLCTAIRKIKKLGYSLLYIDRPVSVGAALPRLLASHAAASQLRPDGRHGFEPGQRHGRANAAPAQSEGSRHWSHHQAARRALRSRKRSQIRLLEGSGQTGGYSSN
jgi:hypothetical protein